MAYDYPVVAHHSDLKTAVMIAIMMDTTHASMEKL